MPESTSLISLTIRCKSFHHCDGHLTYIILTPSDIQDLHPYLRLSAYLSFFPSHSPLISHILYFYLSKHCFSLSFTRFYYNLALAPPEFPSLNITFMEYVLQMLIIVTICHYYGRANIYPLLNGVTVLACKLR